MLKLTQLVRNSNTVLSQASYVEKYATTTKIRMVLMEFHILPFYVCALNRFRQYHEEPYSSSSSD